MLVKKVLQDEKRSSINSCDEAKSRYSEELKMFQIQKNDDEHLSRSLVFKISRTVNSASTSPSEDKNKLVSVKCEPTVEEDSNLKNKIIPESSSEVEMAPCIEIKKEEESIGHERRRSLRILALQAKSKSNQSLDCKKKNTSYECLSPKKEPLQGIKCEGKRISGKKTSKSNKRKTLTVSKDKRKIVLMEAQKRNKSYTAPNKMRLKSMMLVPRTSQKTSSKINKSFFGEHSGVYPKFANVDPSLVLSAVLKQENISKSLTNQMAISLFFPNNHYTAQAMKPILKNISSKENCMKHYNFKRAKHLSYLSKKYRMLDVITLDNCYGLCNYDVRKTETMLLDIISGQEVSAPENITGRRFSDDSLNRDNYFNVVNCHFHTPLTYCRKSVCHANEKQLQGSDSFCRELIVQSIRVLYNVETNYFIV